VPIFFRAERAAVFRRSAEKMTASDHFLNGTILLFPP